MRTLFILALFVSGLFASPSIPPDADTAVASTLNFEASVTGGVTALVTTVAPSIMTFGWSLLAIVSVFTLLNSLLQGTMRSMSGYHHNTLAITVAYVAVLFRIAIATAMMSFYMNPIPGVPFNFHQMFPYLANALSSAINTDLLTAVITDFNNALHYLPSAGMFEVLPGLITVALIVTIALAEFAMTVITVGSYAIVGMLTLCGPLMIPFYVLPGQDKRFWSWFDNMLVYSMYVFVGTGFIFIFCHPYIDFFAGIHSYTVGAWLKGIGYLLLITLGMLWSMWQVPKIAHLLFGGVGGIAEGLANTLQAVTVRSIASVL